MIQENKELLMKDLCARLPYETRVRYTFAFAGAACITEYSDEGILSYDKLQDFSRSNVGYEKRRVVCILPYLRPLSSMTKEEQTELSQLIDSRLNGVDWKAWSLYDKTGIKNGIGGERIYLYDIDFIYDYLNSHRFDYRGLIEKGLALEAEDMYKF